MLSSCHNARLVVAMPAPTMPRYQIGVEASLPAVSAFAMYAALAVPLQLAAWCTVRRATRRGTGCAWAVV